MVISNRHHDAVLSLLDEDSMWWWTLVTDPQVVAAIVGVIGTLIATYQCCKPVHAARV